MEVDRSYAKTKFESLDATMPCCGTNTSLNGLEFGWPAAFSRFAIEARNPAAADPRTVSQIETLLGHNIRAIWEHI